ncbi:hypothetical protein ACH5RR_008433 [Cinchona calisaya]|uniref:Uncharacterized protein n=1 Tax=Cinchona calisaya TaxID=153742 RepID=A0ABD3ABD5_9GENT
MVGTSGISNQDKQLIPMYSHAKTQAKLDLESQLNPSSSLVAELDSSKEKKVPSTSQLNREDVQILSKKPSDQDSTLPTQSVDDRNPSQDVVKITLHGNAQPIQVVSKTTFHKEILSMPPSNNISIGISNDHHKNEQLRLSPHEDGYLLVDEDAQSTVPQEQAQTVAFLHAFV